jgi:hypothetical protein
MAFFLHRRVVLFFLEVFCSSVKGLCGLSRAGLSNTQNVFFAFCQSRLLKQIFPSFRSCWNGHSFTSRFIPVPQVAWENNVIFTEKGYLESYCIYKPWLVEAAKIECRTLGMELFRSQSSFVKLFFHLIAIAIDVDSHPQACKSNWTYDLGQSEWTR